jgi:hypothetical protein
MPRAKVCSLNKHFQAAWDTHSPCYRCAGCSSGKRCSICRLWPQERFLKSGDVRFLKTTRRKELRLALSSLNEDSDKELDEGSDAGLGSAPPQKTVVTDVVDAVNAVIVNPPRWDNLPSEFVFQDADIPPVTQIHGLAPSQVCSRGLAASQAVPKISAASATVWQDPPLIRAATADTLWKPWLSTEHVATPTAELLSSSSLQKRTLPISPFTSLMELIPPLDEKDSELGELSNYLFSNESSFPSPPGVTRMVYPPRTFPDRGPVRLPGISPLALVQPAVRTSPRGIVRLPGFGVKAPALGAKSAAFPPMDAFLLPSSSAPVRDGSLDKIEGPFLSVASSDQTLQAHVTHDRTQEGVMDLSTSKKHKPLLQLPSSLTQSGQMPEELIMAAMARNLRGIAVSPLRGKPRCALASIPQKLVTPTRSVPSTSAAELPARYQGPVGGCFSPLRERVSSPRSTSQSRVRVLSPRPVAGSGLGVALAPVEPDPSNAPRSDTPPRIVLFSDPRAALSSSEDSSQEEDRTSNAFAPVLRHEDPCVDAPLDVALSSPVTARSPSPTSLPPPSKVVVISDEDSEVTSDEEEVASASLPVSIQLKRLLDLQPSKARERALKRKGVPLLFRPPLISAAHWSKVANPKGKRYYADTEGELWVLPSNIVSLLAPPKTPIPKVKKKKKKVCSKPATKTVSSRPDPSHGEEHRLPEIPCRQVAYRDPRDIPFSETSQISGNQLSDWRERRSYSPSRSSSKKTRRGSKGAGTRKPQSVVMQAPTPKTPVPVIVPPAQLPSERRPQARRALVRRSPERVHPPVRRRSRSPPRRSRSRDRSPRKRHEHHGNWDFKRRY